MGLNLTKNFDINFEHSRRVLYYETDRMGVVHHSNYLRFVEEARIEWIRHNVGDYSELEKLGIIVPCLNAYSEFKAYLRYDDIFSTKIILSSYKGAKFKFDYVLYNKTTNEICNTGYTTHFFVKELGNEQYKPIMIRKELPELDNRFLEILKETENQKIA